jgi:hypothetical protein
MTEVSISLREVLALIVVTILLGLIRHYLEQKNVETSQKLIPQILSNFLPRGIDKNSLLPPNLALAPVKCPYCRHPHDVRVKRGDAADILDWLNRNKQG